MIIKVLMIGGPADGELRYVPDYQTEIEVVPFLPFSISECNKPVAEAISKVITYRVFPALPINDKTLYLAIAPDLSMVDAVRRLIENYRPRI